MIVVEPVGVPSGGMPAGEDAAVGSAPGVVLEFPDGSPVGDEGGDPDEGDPDEAGHEEPHDPLDQGQDPVQGPVQESGRVVFEGTGNPLEGAAVRLVTGAAALADVEEGAVVGDAAKGALGVSNEELKPEALGTIELELTGGVPEDGPVLKGIDIEPAVGDEGAASALLDPTAEVGIPAGEESPGEVRLVASDGAPVGDAVGVTLRFGQYNAHDSVFASPFRIPWTLRD